MQTAASAGAASGCSKDPCVCRTRSTGSEGPFSSRWGLRGRRQGQRGRSTWARAAQSEGAAGAGTEAALQGPGRRRAGAHPAARGPGEPGLATGHLLPRALPRRPPPGLASAGPPEARSLPPPALSGPRVPATASRLGRRSWTWPAAEPLPRALCPGPHHPQAVSSPSRRCRHVGLSAARRCQCLQSRGPGSRQAPSRSAGSPGGAAVAPGEPSCPPRSPAGPRAILGHLAAISSLSLHTGRTQDQELLAPPRRARVDPRPLGPRPPPNPATSSKAWGASPPTPPAPQPGPWTTGGAPPCSCVLTRPPAYPANPDGRSSRPADRPRGPAASRR